MPLTISSCLARPGHRQLPSQLEALFPVLDDGGSKLNERTCLVTQGTVTFTLAPQHATSAATTERGGRPSIAWENGIADYLIVR